MSSTLPWAHGSLRVSKEGRHLEHADGTPFFWLADTAWLMLTKLTEMEAEAYLENRRRKGFNVVQIMLIHSIPVVNMAGDMAFQDFGCDSWNGEHAGYWSFVDRIIDLAAQKGMYAALVPVWGTVVDQDRLTVDDARTYGKWLAERYRDRPNIVWMNGGDTRGNEHMDIWDALGETIRQHDPNHLITFHPFGRMQSSLWFHDRSWLDFHMFQSGHRRYDQKTLDGSAVTWDDWRGDSSWKGEDNWRYVLEDLSLAPQKPTLDGEPSYENIPQGLHDPTQPYWTAADSRRYLWWSLLAGACGHTYGDNAVMQFHRVGDEPGSYGVRNTWQEAIDDPGAGQMIHARRLMASLDWFSGQHDADAIDGDAGERHDRILAMRGSNWLIAYTFTGRSIQVRTGAMSGRSLDAFWYGPATGALESIGSFPNEGTLTFKPSGPQGLGNDHVLILTEAGSFHLTALDSILYEEDRT